MGERLDINPFANAKFAQFIKKNKEKYREFQRNPNADNSHIKYFTRKPPEDNVPVVVKSKEEMYEEMRKAVRTMRGTNFVLGMQRDDGQLEVWRRENQPCQGGEMRKYGVTHDDSTRPDDPRPTDLRYPFPDGKPLAVGIGARGTWGGMRVLFNPLSPYCRGYGGEENVEFIHCTDKSIKGFIALNADLVEPTVLINLAHKLNQGVKYEDLLNHLTIPEYALFNNYVTGFCYGGGFSRPQQQKDHKDNFNFVKLRKFLRGGVESTYDLSGGVLGGRVDYNRPNLFGIFKGEVGTNTSIGDIINKAFFDGKIPPRSVKDIISRVSEYKAVLKDFARKEAE